MLRILTSDWHLTDIPEDAYRWDIINILYRMNPDEIFILGDLCDRKDRHSAVLVNQVVENLRTLASICPVTVLMGNHDIPLSGPPFWSFLKHVSPNLSFITKPTARRDGLLLLPYASNPKEAWKGISWELYQCLMIHQTVSGVQENGQVFENKSFPLLPKNLIIYSGDIHTPQVVRGVTYVGAPHRVRYGDDHETRILALKPDWTIDEVIPVKTLRKAVVNIDAGWNQEVIDSLLLRRGDRVRFRVHLEPNQIEQWPVEQQLFHTWATEHGIIINGLEAVVSMKQQKDIKSPAYDADPRQILTEFAKHEGLEEKLVTIGAAILKEEQIQ